MKSWQFLLEEQVKLKKEVGAITKCPKCGAPIQPHRVCTKCGYYKGSEVITVATEEKTEE